MWGCFLVVAVRLLFPTCRSALDSQPHAFPLSRTLLLSLTLTLSLSLSLMLMLLLQLVYTGFPCL